MSQETNNESVATPQDAMANEIANFFDEVPYGGVQEIVAPAGKEQEEQPPVVPAAPPAGKETVSAVTDPEAPVAAKPDTSIPDGQIPPEISSDSLEKDMEELRKQFADAVGELAQLKAQTTQPAAPQEPVMKLPEDPKALSQVDFVGELNPADYLENKESFNQLLNKIATVAAQAGAQAGYERAIMAVPGVVNQSTAQQFVLRDAAQQLYAKYPELTSFKQAVSAAAMDIYSKEPQLPMAEVFEKAAQTTKNLLRLRGTQTNRVPAQPSAPSSGVSRNTTTKPLTSVEQAIMDLIELP